MKAFLLAMVVGLGLATSQAVPMVNTLFEQDNWGIKWAQTITPTPTQNYEFFMNGYSIAFIGGISYFGTWNLVPSGLHLQIGENLGSVIIDGIEIYSTPFTIIQPTGPEPRNPATAPDAGSTIVLLVMGLGVLHLAKYYQPTSLNRHPTT